MTPRALSRSLRVAVLALGVAGPGCLLGDVSGVPCAVDDECPTGTFCDLLGGVCITTAADGMPPNVEILGVEGEDGKPRSFTNVAADEDAAVTIHITNDGGYVAEEVEIELSRLSCAPMSYDADDVPARLDPGETKKVGLRIHIERDCANPVPVDWFVRFSGRDHRGVFELFHEAGSGEEYD